MGEPLKLNVNGANEVPHAHVTLQSSDSVGDTRFVVVHPGGGTKQIDCLAERAWPPHQTRGNTRRTAQCNAQFNSFEIEDSPQVASVAKSISDIRQVDFKNFTYRLESAKEKEVFRLRAGRQVSADGAESGLQRITYILSIRSLGSNFKVEGGLLILDQAILREGEYVPTQYYTIKYRWNGIKMVEVERSSLKPLPEGMREIG